MAEFGVGFKVFADTSQFQREMRASVEGAKQVQRGLKDIGINVGRFLGVAGTVGAFRHIISSAMDLRTEIEKVGGAVDSSVASVARLGDGFAAIKTTTTEWGINALSFFTKAGEGYGMILNRLRGITKEQEAAAEATAAAATAQEKQLAKSRDTNSPEKLAAAERELAVERRRNTLADLDLNARLNALIAERQRAEQDLVSIAPKTVAYKTKQLEIERLTGEVTKTRLEVEQDIQKKVNVELERFFDSVKHSAEEINRTQQERLALEQSIADAAERAAEAKAREKEQAAAVAADIKTNSDRGVKAGLSTSEQAALSKWISEGRQGNNPLERFGTGQVRTSDVLGRASDSELKALQDKNNSTITLLNGLTDYASRTAMARLQIEIGNIKQEMDFREGLRRDTALGGEALARSNFRGDPLAFDKFFTQYVQDNRSASQINAENNKLLTDIRDRFRTGVPVVNLNAKPAP